MEPCCYPEPGPLYWDYRCLNCNEPIDDHPPFLKRMSIRFKRWVMGDV